MSIKELRQKRKASGLCTECGNPAREGKTTCAECARKKYESEKRNILMKRGDNWTDERGRPQKWIFTAWRGRTVVARGSAKEVAERFGMSEANVHEYVRKGFRRKKDGVFFERERI